MFDLKNLISNSHVGTKKLFVHKVFKAKFNLKEIAYVDKGFSKKMV